MKQIDGQISMEDYLSTRDGIFPSCSSCICRSCLYWWSARCPYGGCYDDFRAKDNPYDKAHPGEPPRTLWSNWNKPGEQAHWCRGGVFYPEHYCERFVKYKGSVIEECVDCNIQVFQDGFISCSTKDAMGCEACIDRKQMEERIKLYGCQWMTETGCEAHINALSLMANAIINEGEDIEMCKEQCCIGCAKTCGYRCGQANGRKT